MDVVIGCVGAGSNFGGIALPFFVQSPGEYPLLMAAESSATPKLTRGVYAYDVTDATGTGPMEPMYTIGSRHPIPDSHSAGLRFHGVAKLLSAMRHHGQIEATAVGQVEALEAGRQFTVAESILPAPESGHALAVAARLACEGRSVLVCGRGHGYLDLAAYDEHLTGTLHDESPSDESLRAAVAELPLVHSVARVAHASSS